MKDLQTTLSETEASLSSANHSLAENQHDLSMVRDELSKLKVKKHAKNQQFTRNPGHIFQCVRICLLVIIFFTMLYLQHVLEESMTARSGLEEALLCERGHLATLDADLARVRLAAQEQETRLEEAGQQLNQVTKKYITHIKCLRRQ